MARHSWPLLADAPGLSLLRMNGFLLTNSLEKLEDEFLIAVKGDGQIQCQTSIKRVESIFGMYQ